MVVNPKQITHTLSQEDIDNIRIANFLTLPVTQKAPLYSSCDVTALYLIRVLALRFRLKVNLSFDGQYWTFDISDPAKTSNDLLGLPKASCSVAIANSTVRYIEKMRSY